MDARGVGTLVAVAGAVLVVLGLLTMSGALSWFGRMPGDLRFGSGNVRVYIPFVSMLLLSLVISLLLGLLRR